MWPGILGSRDGSSTWVTRVGALSTSDISASNAVELPDTDAVLGAAWALDRIGVSQFGLGLGLGSEVTLTERLDRAVSGGEEGGGEGGRAAAAAAAYEITVCPAGDAFAGPEEDRTGSGTGATTGLGGLAALSFGGGVAGWLLGALVRPIRANPRALYVET